MASKWLMLADLLEFDTVTMTYLTESMKRYNDEWNCYRIFRYWIRGYGGQPCTWRKLIELLEDCDEEELTEDVKNALS